jgi:hypothetical protein
MAPNPFIGGQPIYMNFSTVDLAITLTVTSTETKASGNSFSVAIFAAGTPIPVLGSFTALKPPPKQLVIISPQQTSSITFDVPSGGGFVACDGSDGTYQMEVDPWGNEP